MLSLLLRRCLRMKLTEVEGNFSLASTFAAWIEVCNDEMPMGEERRDGNERRGLLHNDKQKEKYSRYVLFLFTISAKSLIYSWYWNSSARKPVRKLKELNHDFEVFQGSGQIFILANYRNQGDWGSILSQGKIIDPSYHRWQ